MNTIEKEVLKILQAAPRDHVHTWWILPKTGGMYSGQKAIQIGSHESRWMAQRLTKLLGPQGCPWETLSEKGTII